MKIYVFYFVWEHLCLGHRVPDLEIIVFIDKIFSNSGSWTSYSRITLVALWKYVLLGPVELDSLEIGPVELEGLQRSENNNKVSSSCCEQKSLEKLSEFLKTMKPVNNKGLKFCLLMLRPTIFSS